MVTGIASEIQKAALILKEQISRRFPKLQLLDSFALFDHNGTPSLEQTNAWLQILADHYGYDPARLRNEYEDVKVLVKRAKDNGCKSLLEVWDAVITTIRKEHSDMQLRPAVELFYALQCQN